MSIMADTSRLLEEIRDGIKLRSVKTVDKSKPLILAENESLKNVTRTALPPLPCPQPPPLPLGLDSDQNGHSINADRTALMNEIRAGIKLRHIDAPVISKPVRVNCLENSKVTMASKQHEEDKVANRAAEEAHTAIVRQVVAELKTTKTFHSPLSAAKGTVDNVSLTQLPDKQATNTFTSSCDSFPLTNSVNQKCESKQKGVTMSSFPARSPAKMRSEMRIQLSSSQSTPPCKTTAVKTVEENKKLPPVSRVSAKSFMAVTLKEPSTNNLSPWALQTVRVSPRGWMPHEKKGCAPLLNSIGRTAEKSSKQLSALTVNDRAQLPKGKDSGPILPGIQSDKEMYETNGSTNLHLTEVTCRNPWANHRSDMPNTNAGGCPANSAKQQTIKTHLSKLGLTFPGLHEAANEASNAFRGIKFEIDVDDPHGSFLKVQRCPDT
uniref:WH2 domain-containing protein n=2 Tax=Trichuris muris TaxID=70415 RepID=A0A5S6QZJ4_TRIMR